jgi:hypothetical protein
MGEHVFLKVRTKGAAEIEKFPKVGSKILWAI